MASAIKSAIENIAVITPKMGEHTMESSATLALIDFKLTHGLHCKACDKPFSSVDIDPELCFVCYAASRFLDEEDAEKHVQLELPFSWEDEYNLEVEE